MTERKDDNHCHDVILRGEHGALVPEKLRQRLVRRQCVAYVGAGFSMACGMPNWIGLLRDLVLSARQAECSGRTAEYRDAIDTCVRAIETGQLTMAASLLRKLLPPADMDEAVRQRFGNHVLAQAEDAKRKSMESRLRSLVRGPWSGIVTTNYDVLIERAIGEWVDREVVMVSEDNPRLGTVLASPPSAGFFFVKTHGSVSGGRVVLSTEEYDRTYLGTDRMTSFLSAMMLRYFVVFVGCSLEDEIVRMRRKLSVDFDGLIPSAYALLPDTEQNRVRSGWLREFAKIESILYPSLDTTHESVQQFLEQAAGCSDIATAENPTEDLTRSDLSKLPVPQRLEKIGSVNRDLLELIQSRPNHAIDHLDLVNLTRLDDANIKPPLFELSEEERVYRVLFLVSVSLVSETRVKGGAVRYVLPNDTIIALR